MEGVDRKKCLLPAVKSVRRLSTHACGYRYFGVRRRGHPAVCGRACIYVMRHRRSSSMFLVRAATRRA